MYELMAENGARTPQTLGILEVTKSYEAFVRVACGNVPSIGTVCIVATMQGFNADELGSVSWSRILRGIVSIIALPQVHNV